MTDFHNHHRRFPVLPVLLGAAALFLTGLAAAQAPPSDEAENPEFLRVVERPGESISLEVAARTFRPTGEAGPEVALIGVAHIADKSLYDSLQKHLDQFDLVLYESVRPAGAARPAGATDPERIERTMDSLRFVAGCVKAYRDRIKAYPATTADLIIGLQAIDPRLSQWSEQALTDAWGTDVLYQRLDDGERFALISLGADRAAGGEGPAADIVVDSTDAFDPLPMSAEDGVQAKLADLLGLQFQLSAIDYGRPNWRCSDTTVDRLEHSLRAEGIDFFELDGSFAGGGFSESVANALIKLVKVLDVLTDGRMSDMAKIMMIDILGDETFTSRMLEKEFGGAFARTLIADRNQIVIDDLKRVMADESEVRRIAIFYGAAHMPDFANRLREDLGYTAGSAEWFSAMKVDLRQSALSEGEVQQIRRMLRHSLRGLN